MRVLALTALRVLGAVCNAVCARGGGRGCTSERLWSWGEGGGGALGVGEGVWGTRGMGLLESV